MKTEEEYGSNVSVLFDFGGFTLLHGCLRSFFCALLSLSILFFVLLAFLIKRVGILMRPFSIPLRSSHLCRLIHRAEGAYPLFNNYTPIITRTIMLIHHICHILHITITILHTSTLMDNTPRRLMTGRGRTRTPGSRRIHRMRQSGWARVRVLEGGLRFLAMPGARTTVERCALNG